MEKLAAVSFRLVGCCCFSGNIFVKFAKESAATPQF